MKILPWTGSLGVGPGAGPAGSRERGPDQQVLGTLPVHKLHPLGL